MIFEHGTWFGVGEILEVWNPTFKKHKKEDTCSDSQPCVRAEMLRVKIITTWFDLIK